MDTIIYFYQLKNSISAPQEQNFGLQIREYARKEYRLVQVGLPKEAVSLLEGNDPEENIRQDGNAPGDHRGRFRIWGGLFRKKRGQKLRREARRKREAEKEGLLRCLGQCWGDELSTYCISQPGITYFDGWRFREYREIVWVERLLADIELPHFLVLGYCDKLEEILFAHAHRMKSLKICVTAQDYREELEDLAEELFEEYGLAAVLEKLEEGQDYRSLKSLMRDACNVLDFSGEPSVNPHIVPRGSVWYDMDACEEKKRELQEGVFGISYKSLTVP